MLLFTDGFEHFDVDDIALKWGTFGCGQVDTDLNNHIYRNRSAKIVFGDDPLVPGKPYSRKGGRALYLGKHGNLTTTFRKSRTVFTGLALRVRAQTTVVFHFLSMCDPHIVRRPSPVLDKSTYTPTQVVSPEWTFDLDNTYKLCAPTTTYQLPSLWEQLGPITYAPSSVAFPAFSGSCVARCIMTINQYNVGCRWEFASGLSPQVGSINLNADAYKGDYFYYQAGFSLLGSDPAFGITSWVENRIGNRPDKNWRAQCQVAYPTYPSSYYVNGMGLVITGVDSATNKYVCVDDVYIANDEGDVNNSFLGAICIKGRQVSSEGTVNDSEPHNIATLNRGDAVTSPLVNTWDTLPDPLPDPGVNPGFIEFSNPLDNYTTLYKHGNQQTFRLYHSAYGGAEPTFFGAIAYAMMRAKYADGAQSKAYPIMKLGVAQPVRGVAPFRQVSYAYRRPLCPRDTYDFEVRRLIFENPDGPGSLVWNTVTLNEAEFGIELVKEDGTPADYAGVALRRNVIIDEKIRDNISFFSDVSRFLEESCADWVGLGDFTKWDYGFTVNEELILADYPIFVMGYQFLIDEQLLLTESFLTVYPQLDEMLGFADEVTLSWGASVESSIEAVDEPYHFWVEEFNDAICAVSAVINDIVISVSDELAFDEPYIWDGHEMVDESLVMLSSDVFDNHFSADEYLGLSDDPIFAWVELLNDAIDFYPDHFGGNIVEELRPNVNLADSVLTQQWRHTWFMGVLIMSVQVGPVEQPGNDGYRVGDVDEEIFGG